MKLALWFSKRRLVNIAVAALATVVAMVAWPWWRTTTDDRPYESSPLQVKVGLQNAPSDTRVFFDHGIERGTVLVVLGQSLQVGAPDALFRIEFLHALTPLADGTCASQTEYVCADGDGSLTETPDDFGLRHTVAGTFSPASPNFFRVHLATSGGMFDTGPYHSLVASFRAIDFHSDNPEDDKWEFPEQGVEVEFDDGFDPGRRQIEQWEPAGFAMYPDGPAVIVSRPGGPVNIVVSDRFELARIRRRSELAGLVIGIALALAVQALYELAKEISDSSRGRAAIWENPNRP